MALNAIGGRGGLSGPGRAFILFNGNFEEFFRAFLGVSKNKQYERDRNIQNRMAR